LEVAARHRVLILEDDAYHGLLYEGEVPPWLWTLDDRGLVLHCGTLSKTLATGIRLGWVGGPANLIALITALKDDGGTSPFAGYIAAQYAQNGRLEQHTKTLIELYGRKRDRMLAGLERYMPQGVRWTHPQGGFFIWLELPRGLDTGKFLSKALAAGVSYVPGARCFASGSGQNCIRLSFSFVKLDQIELGIHILAEVIKAELESYSY
jgi:2-aminoadipate transaminase